MGCDTTKSRWGLLLGLLLAAGITAVTWAGTFEPITVSDQTATAPLADPVPSSYQPRYISGFGAGDTFTVFFEDRDAANLISYVSTTTGPTGFASAVTATNITDTHFVVKDWPINIAGTDYAFRGWGSVGNNMEHHFYVSNDLTNWVLVSTFTIPNAAEFTNAHGWVYYGFHDVIELNGTFYAFAESNQSQTMLVRSVNGDDVWEAFASVGGRPGDGPLELPAGVATGWTPSGAFVDLGHDRGYGKLHVDPRDSNFYLAVNTAAEAGLPPADLEAAFIDPANWTWHDGTIGPAANPILSETAEHDLRECWVIPGPDPDDDWMIIYDADFGTADGGKALGYATLSPPLPPPEVVWVDDDWAGQADVDAFDPSLIWQYDAFGSLQDGIDAVAEAGTVNVRDGIYGVSGQANQDGYSTAILIKGKANLTIQAEPGHEPVVKPITAVEADIVSVSIEACDGLTMDNIDSDQTVAQFDNWHVFDTDNLTLRNARFEGGEDGIDFNTSASGVVIEACHFIDVNSGSGDEVLDFTDASYSDIWIQDNEFVNTYRNITANEPGGSTIDGLVIRRNWMDGTMSQEAIRLIGASNVLIENNVIMYSMQQGVYIDSGCASITIQHNTFFNNDQELDGNGEIRTKVGTADILIRNNIFCANGNNPAIETTAASLPGEDHNLVFNSVDTLTFGANTILGMDPLFVDTTAGSEDLHLQPKSPAIEAGLDVGVAEDFDQALRPNPPGSSPDIGAYEAALAPFVPRAEKLAVLEALEALLPVNGRAANRCIEKAVFHLEMSLQEELWVDDEHLTELGIRVFEQEKTAVHELMKIVDGPPEIAEALEMLVRVDEALAQTAIDEALAAGANPKDIEKAIAQMVTALEEIADGDYDRAIEAYKQAWHQVSKRHGNGGAGPAALELGDNFEIMASPNPVRSVHTAHFQVKDAAALGVEEIWVQIFDLSGKLVWEEMAQGGELDWHTDNLSGEYLANGIYIYRVQLRIGGIWAVSEIGRIAVSL